MIGVIGLGAMGLPMALRLAESNDVVAFDVSEQQMVRAVEGGVRAASSLAHVGKQALTVVLALRDEQQLFDALFGEGGVAHEGTGLAFVLTSTVGISAARSIASRLENMGHTLVDAPISGGPKRARVGDLLVTVGAPDRDYQSVEPVLAQLAGSLVVVGPRVGDGQAMKTVNQLLCGIHIAAAAEALTLAEALGIDPAVALPVLNSGAAQSFMLADRGPRMLLDQTERDENVSSRLDIFVKDMGIVMTAAQKVGLPVPVAAATEQSYKLGVAHGLGASDDSSLVQILSPKHWE